MAGGGSGRNAVLKPGKTLMLGHFQTAVEFGTGATGVVYQRTDFSVGHVVVIETPALAQKFAADDLEKAGARFSREAGNAARRIERMTECQI